MKGISFFAFITGLVLLGGYILSEKKTNAYNVPIISQKTENVSRETTGPERVVVEQEEVKPVLTDSSLIHQIQTLINDIRTFSMGNYENLKKESFNYNFGTFDWNIGPVDGKQFFIELKNIDKNKCNKLVNAFMDAITVKVNSTMKKDCDNLNNIMFIFN